MKTYIANFGVANYLWPDCLRRNTLATFDDQDLFPFWKTSDKDGYIAHCKAHKRNRAGASVTTSVASRWFNVLTTISETDGDLWIHREKDEIWWTVSRAASIDVSLLPASKPAHPGELVYVVHKPAQPWSNQSKTRSRLEWKALHPKSRDFLSTESTLQQLSGDYAAYTQALINGDDLTHWHNLRQWKEREANSKQSPASNIGALQLTVFRMARTAMETVAAANGQIVASVAKVKNSGFASEEALRAYIESLIRSQNHRCALTGLPMLLDREEGDAELRCSLDRIDSAGHYEEGNLQVVCRFVNRWKGADDNQEFKRLLSIVRQ